MLWGFEENGPVPRSYLKSFFAEKIKTKYPDIRCGRCYRSILEGNCHYHSGEWVREKSEMDDMPFYKHLKRFSEIIIGQKGYWTCCSNNKGYKREIPCCKSSTYHLPILTHSCDSSVCEHQPWQSGMTLY